MNLLEIIPTPVKHVASTHGGEYAGTCPWCGGEDRFHVWPEQGEAGTFWCRGCERAGDAIEFIRQFHGRTFPEACAMLGQAHKVRSDTPVPKVAGTHGAANLTIAPCEAWQGRGLEIAREAAARLWTDEGAKALAYLRGRGFGDDIIRYASLGFNPYDAFEDREAWGLEPVMNKQTGKPKQVFVPRGITIPWVIGSDLWRLNVRRAENDPKYMGPAGCSNGLYQAHLTSMEKPVVLVEGEFDALSIMQAAHEIICPVATGSTDGSRRMRWIARLRLPPRVLVAYDSDSAGEKASEYWIKTLPNAIRWRPYWADANQMLRDGVDLRSWIAAGLSGCKQLGKPVPVDILNGGSKSSGEAPF